MSNSESSMLSVIFNCFPTTHQLICYSISTLLIIKQIQTIDINKVFIANQTDNHQSDNKFNALNQLLGEHNQSAFLDIKCNDDTDCHLINNRTKCLNQFCYCLDGIQMDNNETCKINGGNSTNEKYDGSHMLPIMIVMGIMFVGMCVALNLFSRARFRESRSLFSRDNPRLVKSLSTKNPHHYPSARSIHNSHYRNVPGQQPKDSITSIQQSIRVDGKPNQKGQRQGSAHDTESIDGKSNSRSSNKDEKIEMDHSKFEEIPIASTSKC